MNAATKTTRVGSADLGRGLAADGLGIVIGGMFNTFPHTSFSQNVGLVGITGVRSRFVVAVSGAILVLFGLAPKMGAVVATIPNAVLGGAGVCMFGMVAATGIRILSRVDYELRHNLLIIAVSIAAGMIPVVALNFFDLLLKDAPWLGTIVHSGITLAAVAAVLLNALFNGGGTGDVARNELAKAAGAAET